MLSFNVDSLLWYLDTNSHFLTCSFLIDELTNDLLTKNLTLIALEEVVQLELVQLLKDNLLIGVLADDQVVTLVHLVNCALKLGFDQFRPVVTQQLVMLQ